VQKSGRRAMKFLPAVNNFAGDDCGHWRAFELAAVEGSIAGFAGGIGGAESPGVIGGKKCEVGGLSGGDAAFHAKNARGPGGEKLDEAHEFDASGVDELIEAESERSFKSGDAEWSFIEFDGFAGGFVRRVIGGNGVHRAIGKTCEQCNAIFA
jgi:hypothetical protein